MDQDSFPACPNCGGLLHPQRRRFERRRMVGIVRSERRNGEPRRTGEDVGVIQGL